MRKVSNIGVITLRTTRELNEYLRRNGVNTAYFKDTVVVLSGLVDLSNCTVEELVQIHDIFKKYHITREGYEKTNKYIGLYKLWSGQLVLNVSNLQDIDNYLSQFRRFSDLIVNRNSSYHTNSLTDFSLITEAIEKTGNNDLVFILKYLSDVTEYNNDFSNKIQAWLRLAKTKKQFTSMGKFQRSEARKYFKDNVYPTLKGNKSYLMDEIMKAYK